MAQKPLRWVIVGLGKHAALLAKAILNADQMLVGVVGSEEHAKSFLSKGVVHHEKLLDALGQTPCDAVCIASPNFRHAQEALQSVGAKKHILIEKPMALSMSEAEAIASAAKENNVQGAIDFHLRQHPAVQRARTLISEGKIGEIVHIGCRWTIGSASGSLEPLPERMQWREDPKLSGGGALMARGVHLFDLVRCVSGKEVERIFALSDATDNTVDRTAAAILSLEGGVNAFVLTSKEIFGATNGIEITGKKGSLWLDIFSYGEHALHITSSDGHKEERCAQIDLYTAVFQDIASMLDDKVSIGATLIDGLHSVAITEAFQQSVRDNRAITVQDV